MEPTGDPATDPRRPLIDWLLQKHPDTPKTRAKQWILAGRVTLRGAVVRRPQELLEDPGDALVLLGRNAGSADVGTGCRIHPRVELLYLDAALAVVNKGPSLLAVSGAGGEISALSILDDFLAGELRPARLPPGFRNLPAAFRRLRPEPVHRLDQYTSGLFCLALNPGARASLIQQVRSHTMKREYVAFVQGRPAQPQGTWRHWLRLSEDGFRQQVVPRPPGDPDEQGAEAAITHFETLATYVFPKGGSVVSKLRIRLETGLKHQIRIQAAAAGLPLIGDRVYNPDYRGESPMASALPFTRQALHAEKLELVHPEQPGKQLSWTAEWPPDLRELAGNLRRWASGGHGEERPGRPGTASKSTRG
jgi:23S rRNA pseudouridine1911/1915/1917 synthase